MRFGISIEDERKRFQSYMSRLQILQSKVILLSVVTLAVLAIVRFAHDQNMLSISEENIILLSSVQFSALIIVASTVFLKISTPILDSFLFFTDHNSRSLILRVWNYGVWVITVVAIFAQFTGNIESLGISIGVFSAGLAIALQQPITSLLGWLVVISKRSYVVGDRILVKSIKGDVVEITPFYTVLRQVGFEPDGDDPTGIKITLPNNIILSEPILNYSADFPHIWDRLTVAVTYESDVELAKELITKAAKDVLGDRMKQAVEKMKPHLYGTPQEDYLSEEPIIYLSLADSSVNVTVKYICKVHRRHKTKSDITNLVLTLFSQNAGKVSIAYPHTELVFHDESIEGAFKKYLERKR